MMGMAVQNGRDAVEAIDRFRFYGAPFEVTSRAKPSTSD